MSMENQVTSLEQSQRLLELGVPAENASMVWNICRAKWSLQEWHLEYTPVGGRCVGDETSITQTLPAFTVADLLGMLPFKIEYYGMEMFLSFDAFSAKSQKEYHTNRLNTGTLSLLSTTQTIRLSIPSASA